MSDFEFDYTNVDYKGFKQMMIETLQEKIPEYTDTSETDAGIVILEALAKIMDILSYYQNAQANECYLVTAELRSSLLKWCKMLGYSPRSSIPAKYHQYFVIRQGSGEVTIPKGTVLRTKEKTSDSAVFFTTLEDLSIVADDSAKNSEYFVGMGKEEDGEEEFMVFSVDVAHGTLVDNEVIGVADGVTVNQKFTLDSSPVSLPDYDDDGYALMPFFPDGTASFEYPEGYDESRKFLLTVDGVYWNMKRSFIDSTALSRDYTVEVNQDSTVTIIFGDGVNGKIPSGEIAVSYRRGGGTGGNVGAKTITQLVSPIQGVVSTYNPDLPYCSGEDKETINEIKKNAPNSYRTKWGCFQEEDYADRLMSLFPQVLMAKSFSATLPPKSEKELDLCTIFDPDDIRLIDTILICVLPKESIVNEDGSYKKLEDFGSINDENYLDLKESMVAKLEERALLGTYCELVNFQPKNIKLDCTLLPKSGYDFDTLAEAVNDYLTECFAIGRIQAGQTLSLNEFEADIYDASQGIRAFRINSFSVDDIESDSLDITSYPWEIIQLEDVNIHSSRT